MSVLKEKSRIRSIGTNLVFPSQAETKILKDNLRRALIIACKRANVEGITFHTFRHTFASRLVQAGVDLYSVQKLGRWKEIKMVMRYAHHHPESLRAGIEKLDVAKASHYTISSQSPKGVDNPNL